MSSRSTILYLKGNHNFLNFSTHAFYLPTPLLPAGARFSTVEHYFQAMKVFYMVSGELGAVDEWFNYIIGASTPKAAKSRGSEVPLDLEAWNQTRVGIMFQGQYAKFSAHSLLRQALEVTDGLELVESRRDRFWGYPGENWCGKCLMRVREILITGPA